MVELFFAKIIYNMQKTTICKNNIETSPLTFSANQWTDFYMIGTSLMKELTES